MKFLMMVKGSTDTEAGAMPSQELVDCMMKYNEALVKAGVLLDGAGLQPTKTGMKIKFSGGRKAVLDGPFTEAREIIAGYWLIQCKTREEAFEWARRAPNPAEAGRDGEIEVRQLHEIEEIIPDEASVLKFRELERLSKERP